MSFKDKQTGATVRTNTVKHEQHKKIPIFIWTLLKNLIGLYIIQLSENVQAYNLQNITLSQCLYRFFLSNYSSWGNMTTNNFFTMTYTIHNFFLSLFFCLVYIFSIISAQFYQDWLFVRSKTSLPLTPFALGPFAVDAVRTVSVCLNFILQYRIN